MAADQPIDEDPRARISEGLILWRRLDTPGHDACHFVREARGWRLEGAAVFSDQKGPARLIYAIDCDAHWHTRSGWVRGELGSDVIDLEISSFEGAWRLNGAVVDGVADCIDLDLGFTPATNLFSIRRLALVTGQRTVVRTAWLDVSALALRVLEQRYERRSESAYWYEAPEFGYAAELDVHSTGLIRRYPGLWEEEA